MGSQKRFPLGGESLGNLPHLSSFLCPVTGRAPQRDTKEITPETYEKAPYKQNIIILINMTPYLFKLKSCGIHHYPEPTKKFYKLLYNYKFFFPQTNPILYGWRSSSPYRPEGIKWGHRPEGPDCIKRGTGEPAWPLFQDQHPPTRCSGSPLRPVGLFSLPSHTTSHLLKLMNHERKMMISFRNYQY